MRNNMTAVRIGIILHRIFELTEMISMMPQEKLSSDHVLKNNPFYFFLFCCALLYFFELFLFWPGVIRPDSLAQLQQAQTGIFSDHHPPVMALYWGVLNFIWPGPGLLFLTHLSLLFGAAVCFASV